MDHARSNNGQGLVPEKGSVLQCIGKDKKLSKSGQEVNWEIVFFTFTANLSAKNGHTTNQTRHTSIITLQPDSTSIP